MQVDLYQTRCRYLVKHHSVWIDQKMMFRTRHTRGNVCKDQIVPTVASHQTISSSKVHPDLPLFWRNQIANVGSFYLLRGAHIHPFARAAQFRLMHVTTYASLSYSTRNRWEHTFICRRSPRH